MPRGAKDARRLNLDRKIDGSLCGIKHIPGVIRNDRCVAFFLLGDQKLLFSETTQQIYVLNDLAAFIWCCLEEGRSLSEICADIAQKDLDEGAAQKCVDQSVRHWLKFGLLRIELENADDSPFPSLHSFSVSMGQFRLRMHFANELLARLFTPVFEHLPVSADVPNCILHVCEVNGTVLVFENGKSIICCSTNEAVPLLKAHLTKQICSRHANGISFHAATLIRDKKTLLISGPPAAGKTTLAARLLEESFEYAGDDIYLIGPDGTGCGVPFALTLKSGSWKLIRQFRPELESLAIHDRPDQLKVRFMAPKKLASSEPNVTSWIIFIRRTPLGPLSLQPLSRSEALGRMIKGSYSPGGKLTLESCDALKQTIAGAESFELTYSNLESAREAILEICRA